LNTLAATLLQSTSSLWSNPPLFVADPEEGSLVGKTFQKKFDGQFYDGKVGNWLHPTFKQTNVTLLTFTEVLFVASCIVLT